MTLPLAAVLYRNFGKNGAFLVPGIPVKKPVAPSVNFTLISLTSSFTPKAGESAGALKTGREKRNGRLIYEAIRPKSRCLTKTPAVRSCNI